MRVAYCEEGDVPEGKLEHVALGAIVKPFRRISWVVVLVLGLGLAIPAPSRADIGVIVLEPIGALGFFTRVGPAGTYFSNICQDGSPIKMRLCLPGNMAVS